MKTKILITAFLLVITGLQACRNTDKANDSLADSTIEESMTDTSSISRGAGMSVFMENAASSVMMEIALGKLALEKTNIPKIKKFAEKMIKDHTKINEALVELAQRKKLKLPATIPSASQEQINELNKLSGEEFNNNYMKAVIAEYVKALDLFKSASTLGDIEIKNFAAKTLLTLEQHYKTATDLNQQK